jgi:catechol 2,3-dioxygenase-like lactoylglutathione lyase family enzyme
MKLEVVPIGVADADRAKAFYGEKLGFNIDVDQPLGDKRYVQATPRGSGCSISFGVGLTYTKPRRSSSQGGPYGGLMSLLAKHRPER